MINNSIFQILKMVYFLSLVGGGRGTSPSMQNLSSPARDPIHAPCSGRAES